MPDKQDQKKKNGQRKDKQTHAMHEHEAEVRHETHTHNTAGDVEIVTSHHSTHEHALQNKEITKANREAVDTHKDNTNWRHSHVPEAEKLLHDLKAEEAK